MSKTLFYAQSEYSLLQSTIKIEELVKLAEEAGYDTIVLADSAMHGSLKFYRACKQHNIKPIIGLSVFYQANNDKSLGVLIAKDLIGYQNLMKISTLQKLKKGYPLDIFEFEKYKESLIFITPGAYSIIYSHLKYQNVDKALNHLNILKNIFTTLYVGVSLLSPDDYQLFDEVEELARKASVKGVAVSPALVKSADELLALEVLKSIANNNQRTPLSKEEAASIFTSFDEAEMLFAKDLNLLQTREEINARVALSLEYKGFLMPKYQEGLDANAYLYELSLMGLKKRLSMMSGYNTEEYLNRLKYEYGVICSMGFADYFLIVWDFIKYAKNNGIFVGPGRGSAGASLLAFSLGITDIDPIKNNLLFERFLNKERISMPDIDVDFPDRDREQVIQYVNSRYGNSRVAHICTFGTFQAKLAINDTARILKTPEAKLKIVSRYINGYLNNLKAKNIELEKIISETPELKQMMEEDDDVRSLLYTCCIIQGLPRNISTHAAGMIISGDNLINYTALDLGISNIYQTQFEASDLESIGLLKMDFLGLKNLTNIDDTVKLIKKDYPDFFLPKTDDDPLVYQMLAQGDSTGIFQLESNGMRKLLVDLKVKCFDDVVLALALYRPGPMDIISDFIKRKNGEIKVSYPHPVLESILRETYGYIVYQEQIMMIAVKFAGYTLGEADLLRRAISKKKKEIMMEEESKFVQRACAKGANIEVAKEVYDYIVKFADYGFNKAHSVAYAKVAYLTAYLKCHFQSYYFATIMTTFMGDDSSMSSYAKELAAKGITLISPSINQSETYFKSFNKQILFPLNGIRGIGEVTSKELIENRNEGMYTSFKEFLKRTRKILNPSLYQALIYSGALDEFGLSKKAMIDNLESELQMLDYEDFEGMLPIEYGNDEFSYGLLLQKEKEVLGINIKYNFFYQFAYLYKENNLVKLNQAKEGAFVRTLGIVDSIKEIKTKAGENMAFVKVHDDLSEVEVTIFPKLYEEYNLKEGDILIISGKCEKRRNLQILADSLQIK